mgnify:CR=1 FL=1
MDIVVLPGTYTNHKQETVSVSLTEKKLIEGNCMVETLTVFKVFFNTSRDTIVPPFTSKVSRMIVLKALEMSGFKDVVEEIERLWKTKPYIFSVVFDENRPLYKTGKDSEKPIVLKGGKEYMFKLTTIGNYRAMRIVQAISTVGSVEVFNSEISILGVEAKTVDFKSLELKSNIRYVKVELITPALLQLPRPRKLREKTKLRHVLFPIPSLVMHSLAKHWNLFAPETEKIADIKKLAKLSNYILVEVNYKLQPTTVIYDEKRRPRGITGWILYEVNSISKERSRKILKLLNYANYVGIGRSRTIGFGCIKATFQ